MINHVNLNYPKLLQINNPGYRLYETPEGNKYPSITTVLGSTSDHSWVDKWKAAVGEKEVQSVSKRSTLRGSAIHKLCEDYLNNTPSEPSIFDLEMYNQFKKVLVDVDDVYGIEKPLYSNRYQTAGTVDCIAKYKSKLTIIDWKTSSIEKSADDITDYFVQGTFYAISMYEMFNIKIPTVTIVMGVDGNKCPLVFQKNIKDYVPEFVRRRKLFKEMQGY